MTSNQSWLKSRCIVERITIEGELELLTPAHFGSGDAEGAAELSLLRDAYDGSALLPGASIAGALRNYWRERKYGYGAPARDSELFGARRGASKDEMDGEQSLLIVEDSLGPQPQVELRHGVKIDGQTRTAEEKKLFDVELLRAGTCFTLRFELVVLEGQRQDLCQDLALALQGFENGEIGLGARKRRGLGRCRVQGWRVWRHDLRTRDGLLAWLAHGRDWSAAPEQAPGDSLAAKLGVSLAGAPDKRHRLDLRAEFALDGSLLVRSGFGQADQGADAEHLHRVLYNESDPDQAEREPVLPGASLAGVLRARALRIANTLSPHDAIKAQGLVNQLFGVGPEDVEQERDPDTVDHWASRLLVHEAALNETHTLVQNRIRVDRFTGGAMDNYLFNEAPVFTTGDNNLELELSLRDPEDYEIGLLLLLLKDLWTGDLPLGGESGVGRGRLQGLSATLEHRQDGATTAWTIEPDGEKLKVSVDPSAEDEWQSLERFARVLNLHLAGR
jgi:CRISPR/Cas system CSM-associated protein Csm3 (group 7 of RAMP superfamily)